MCAFYFISVCGCFFVFVLCYCCCCRFYHYLVRILFLFKACKVNDDSVIRLYALKTVSVHRSFDRDFIFIMNEYTSASALVNSHLNRAIRQWQNYDEILSEKETR